MPETQTPWWPASPTPSSTPPQPRVTEALELIRSRGSIMSKWLLVICTGAGVLIMWAISALANFTHGYIKGGGTSPFDLITDPSLANPMALIFGGGSVATDLIKAAAIVLAGAGFAHRRYGVAVLALVIWLPAQAYSAYSVSGFVATVMTESIATRERQSLKAELAAKAAAAEVRRLEWMSAQDIEGRGVSARRAKAQMTRDIEAQREAVKTATAALDSAPKKIEADAAAALWQHVIKAPNKQDVSTASMLGLGLVIELTSSLGFFLLSLAISLPHGKRAMAVRPAPEPKTPTRMPVNDNVAAPTERRHEAHIHLFAQHLRGLASAGHLPRSPAHAQVAAAYRAWCERQGYARLSSALLPDALAEEGIESARAGSSRKIIYQLQRAA